MRVHAVQDLKRGAAAVAGKAQAAFEDEVEPNYGILGWRHVRGIGLRTPECTCMFQHPWQALIRLQQRLVCVPDRCCQCSGIASLLYTGKRRQVTG